ncbi:MAG: ABC transporter transmembrane domain-containing protein [Saprospiraceae bacterium]
MSQENSIEIPTTEVQVKPKMSWSRIKSSLYVFKYIKPYKWHFIGGLVLLALTSGLFLALIPMIGKMFDVSLGKPGLKYTLTQLGLILFVILIAQGIISYFRVMLFAVVSEKGTANLRKDLYHNLISLPFTFYEKSRVGEISSRLASDVDQLYSVFSITLAEFLRQLLILVGGILYLLIFYARISLIMLALFPVIVFGAMFFGKFIRKGSKRRQEELANTNVIVDETLQSIYTVKSFTNEPFEYHRYEQKISNLVKVSLEVSKYRALFGTYIIVALFGALFFIIWLGTKYVQTGAMSPGDLLNVFTYTVTIGVSIAGLGNFYTQLITVVGGTERLKEILEKTPEVNVDSDRENILPKIKADIRFEEVQFSYPSRPDMQVLKKVSFKIGAGQKIAFVGSSGVGKSTIAQLLLRFYSIQGGHIYVGGKNINEFEITDYRRYFGIVPQEVLLFGGTIRENILYGKPNATNEEIIAAAKKSNSFEFINSFPDGFETIVGERGIKLSGGQKQRIAIARAILRNPTILILDEATSALDAESEKVVQDALKTLMEGRTSIIIAHRLSTIRDVNCIYVLEDGKIIEQGTHEELASKPNGAYSSLARLQFESNKELNVAPELIA